MTRKDFELIAYAIRVSKLSEAARLRVAEQMARGLAGTNNRFDKQRFIDACMK